MPLKVGDRLMLEHGYNFNMSFKEVTIAKIYKTGKFTLEGDEASPPTQWREDDCQIYDGNGNSERVLCAYRASENWRSSRRYRLLEISEATLAYRDRVLGSVRLDRLRNEVRNAVTSHGVFNSLTEEDCQTILAILSKK